MKHIEERGGDVLDALGRHLVLPLLHVRVRLLVAGVVHWLVERKLVQHSLGSHGTRNRNTHHDVAVVKAEGCIAVATHPRGNGVRVENARHN
eukprot:839925-Prymnesium_polylepis.1